MIVLRKLYSRHTPKGLKRYKEYKDEDFEKMTRGQKLRALEEEDETANSNTNKYIFKKLKKYIPVGAGVGALAGGVLAPKGFKTPAAIQLGLLGAGVGTIAGITRGDSKAKKEGHNRDDRTMKLARRMDDFARRNHKDDDDYEFRVKDNIRSRKAAEDSRAARDYALMNLYR